MTIRVDKGIAAVRAARRVAEQRRQQQAGLFSAAEAPAVISEEMKRDELRRELRYRYKVYPRWVAEGRMSQEAADRQTKILEAILAEGYSP
jgi:hypothetical protein